MKFNFRELNLIEMAVREWLIALRKDVVLDRELRDSYIDELNKLKSRLTADSSWWKIWKD